MGNTYYKEAGNGEVIKLDDKGNKSPSFNKRNSPGLWAEMEKLVAAGAVVEPRFTAEELAAKEAEEAEQALESQKSQCIRLLQESDYKVLTDSPFSSADKTIQKTFRADLRVIIKSSEIKEIPEKPF